MARITLITGAARGIGAATALLAAERGDAVCVNYHRSDEEAEALVSAIRSRGGTAVRVRADVSVEAEVLALFSEIDSTLGPIGLLVNNAGVPGDYGPVAEVSAAAMERMFAINVTGAFLCAREAIRRMARSRGGSGGDIVNVSSRAATLGGPGEWVAYAASKGAIDTMTIGLSKEVAGDGIRVNAVCPGLVETEFHDISPGRLDRMTPGVPMGRAGTAAEIAEAILWLASPAASYVTGARLEVTGGR